MFQWLGLLVTLLTWVGLAILIVPRDGTQGLRSISAHGAANKHAALVFRVLLIGGGLLFYWWLVGWFRPHLHLSAMFTVLITAVVVYQLATGLNNGGKGLKRDIHSYTAQTMALLYIPLAALIIDAHGLSVAARTITACLFVYMVNSYTIVEIMRRLQRYHLALQTAYIVAFQLLILTAAYLS